MRARAILIIIVLSVAMTQGAQDRPIGSLPYTPSLDVKAMDTQADPCVDFYQYSCGTWMKTNTIPPDQASWSVYRKLYDDNLRFLWGILDDLSKPRSTRNANQQKIGDFFAACMDEAAVERLGSAPLKPALDEIAALNGPQGLAVLLAHEHLTYGSSGFLFDFGSSQDYNDAEQVIAFAWAGGLGLPDRDYYTKPETASEEIRQKYVAHVHRMLELLGDPPDQARAGAAAVMRLETALAKASLTRVESRDPYNLSHRMTRAQLQSLTPSFDWDRYFSGVGLSRVQTVNVTEPAFYKALERELKGTSLADWKHYLRWHLVDTMSPYLSAKFEEANFDFFSRTLRGVQQQPPRWKRCVGLVDRMLGEALGREFVSRAFSPDMKQRTVRMTQQIEDAMERDIRSLTWMSAATRQRALEKLRAIRNKVGYPDRWRDYGPVRVRPDDFAGNVERAVTFDVRRTLGKIGKPVDHTEWSMTPATVNAYYDAQMNDINFPAGVLQPPLYDAKMDDAPNYGNTGGTIGHELTHGFDDEGRQFDAKGNLRDWWTKDDAEQFTTRAACIVDQYSKYTVVDDIKINSKLTLGEDVADLGGEILAWMAWKAEVAGKALDSRDGFTPEQRFFIGFAQWACENQRPENLRVSAITNPHSPGKYRINGVVVNMPEFQEAFKCKAGQPMVAEKACRVW